MSPSARHAPDNGADPSHDTTPRRRSVVVVGVDGSAGSRQALRWAAAEARLRNAPLRVVHAWTFGFTAIPGGGYGYKGDSRGLFGAEGTSELRRASEELVDRAITDIAAEACGIEIERQVVEGGAADVLVGAAAEGDLLVVGSRGHGGFAGLLLGSISQQCAHHAVCPVVIVHADRTPAGVPPSSEAAAAGTAAVAR
jgi:nucleotide-binding universal stress UspA family protein